MQPAIHFRSYCCMLLWLWALPWAQAASSTHPCGGMDWVDGIEILQADFERERGAEITRNLLEDSLIGWLHAIDTRFAIEKSPWRIGWQGEATTTLDLPGSDRQRDLYLSATAVACTLLRQHAPEKAGRWLGNRQRALASEFEKAFIARLGDPAAAFGYNSVNLSLDSPAFKSPNEAYSLQWMDRDFGIARLYLPDLSDIYGDLGPDLDKLRQEAPIKALILDLRGSGGGSLRRLEALLARFLAAGTLAYTVRNRHGQESEIRVQANPLPDTDRHLRLIVLTSSKTRGGAELLAGALQANGRALLVGEPTAGMAGHRRILTLAKDSALLLTEALPCFPGQTDTVTRITPDIAVPAEQAFPTALAFFAENGRRPQNPFIRPDEKRHPLVQAVLDRDEATALRLIEAGAELDVEASRETFHRLIPSHLYTEGYGKTPNIGFPLAIATAALGMPKVLAAIGQRAPALLLRTDTDGRTALAYAALRGYPNTTRYLLTQGLSPLHPAHRYPISSTPLQLAVQLDHAEVVALMMAAIPTTQLGHTAVIEAVWIAAMRDALPTVKSLLEGGASPNYIARQGGTALIAAVEFRKLDMVRLLLKHGATVDEHLYRGFSVLQYAEKNAARGDAIAREILELIRQAPKGEGGWRKSRETETVEELWKMIEPPGKPQKEPSP